MYKQREYNKTDRENEIVDANWHWLKCGYFDKRTKQSNHFFSLWMDNLAGQKINDLIFIGGAAFGKHNDGDRSYCFTFENGHKIKMK